jgi:glutathione peroxidase
MRLIFVSFLIALLASTGARAFTFTALDGSDIDLTAFRGRPVLVVNTASLCGFTPQYSDMQKLYDDYSARGLVVLAVPSDEFRQELSSNDAVADFCRVQTGLTFPITQITRLRGEAAHPFYRWLADTHGHRPTWNFNKALIGPEGELLGFWGSTTRPTSGAITRAIRSALQ